MIHLMTGLYDTVVHQKEFRILLLGLDNSGKTTVLERLKHTHHQQRQAQHQPKGSSGFESIGANLKKEKQQPLVKGSLIATAGERGRSQQISSQMDGEGGKGKALSVRPTPLNRDIIRPTIGLNIARMSLHGHPLLLWDMGGKQALQSLWYNYTHQCHAVVFVVDASDESRFGEVREVAATLLAHHSLEQVPFLVLLNKFDVILDAQHQKQQQAPVVVARPTEVMGAPKQHATDNRTTTCDADAQQEIIDDDDEEASGGGESTALLHREGTGSGSGGRDQPNTTSLMWNLVERVGLLDVVLSSVTASSARAAAKPPVAVSSSGSSPSSGVVVPTELRGTVGVGNRMFRFLPCSAMYEEDYLSSAPHPTTTGGGGGRADSSPDGGIGLETIQNGLDWVVRFLEHNARHVESL